MFLKISNPDMLNSPESIVMAYLVTDSSVGLPGF